MTGSASRFLGGVVVASVVATFGCDSETPHEPAPPDAAEVQLSADTLALYAGEAAALEPVVRDADGVPIEDAAIMWSVSDLDVVSVDADGALTAVGQGDATVTATAGAASASVAVRVTRFVAIAAYHDPLCAADAEGHVWCAGHEWQGQVFDVPVHETWHPVGGPAGFSSLTAGQRHSCGIAAAAAYCWGSDETGQLGGQALNGFFSAEPAAVETELTFEEVSGGWEHTCGVAMTGDAYCWGRGEEGQLGNAGYAGAHTPSRVTGGHAWRMVRAGWRFSCGVADDGQTYCWGDADSEADTIGATPLVMPAVPNDLEHLRVDDIACGSKGSTVYCWPWSSDVISEPGQTALPGPVVDLVLGEDSYCALVDDGTVHCWGSNAHGLLGDPDVESSATPVQVVTDQRFVALTGEDWLHCGLTGEGAVYCWGIARPFMERSETPTRIPAPRP